MVDYLVVFSGLFTLISLAEIKGSILRLEKGIKWSNMFVAIGFFLICLSQSSFLLDFVLANYFFGLITLIFNFGIVFFILGLFVLFIFMMNDYFYKYSPYVFIIGLSLILIYFQVMLAF
ncbi:hypothetical protein Q5O24_06390 [Eubacteriaceae bacterium ES3]|nr:hypothetical protein Q5O24_06390 [Eubacteriaceae bacterium ES3]